MHVQGRNPLSARSSPARDEQWFEELFRRHHPAVHAYIVRRVPGDREDLVAINLAGGSLILEETVTGTACPRSAVPDLSR